MCRQKRNSVFHLWQDGEGSAIGKVRSTKWDEDKATATFYPFVPAATEEDDGNYKCVIKFSNDEVMSTKSARLRLLCKGIKPRS